MPIISGAQAVNYARAAGFSGDALVNIIAIAYAESGLNTTAQNSSGATGILQILLPVHKDVTYAQAIDPAFSFRYAYKLSRNGTYFCPWQCYSSTICGASGPNGWDNRWAQYLPQAKLAIATSGVGVSTTPTVQVTSASSDGYPQGQCTYWASYRYHQLAGYYPPNTWGDAHSWGAGAQRSQGWSVSATPPAGIASIVCLQANIQGAGGLGHVAVVEKIYKDGSVLSSNLNWGRTPGAVVDVKFVPGPGVSFIWAGSGSAAADLINSPGFQLGTGPATYVPLMDQIHSTLINTPGFYGIALAVDEAEQFPGFINLTDPSVQMLGVPMDVPGMIRSIGATITDNAVPIIIRGDMILLGVLILVLLIVKVVLDVGEKVAPIAAAAM